jgi:hypothetical protein
MTSCHLRQRRHRALKTPKKLTLKSRSGRMNIFIVLSLFLVSPTYAGLVEPCAKWDHLPVKICKGTKSLYQKYNESLENDDASVSKLKNMYKADNLHKLNISFSNPYFPNEELWSIGKDLIQTEYSKEKTGIYFKFIETENLEDCDSVLFFVSGLSGMEGLSDVGNKGDTGKKMNTNKKRKTPSSTFINLNPTTRTNDDPSFETKRDRMNFSFKNNLVHEIAHLSGLHHSHEYKNEYNKFFDVKDAHKKTKSSRDVCGMDPYSIMSYPFLDWMEGYVAGEKFSLGPNFKTPEDREQAGFEKSRLSQNDRKSLRCLYGAEPGCEVKCK